MDNLTALVSCFARAYHHKTAKVRVFDDTAAERLLGEDYARIAQSMADGAGFFFPELNISPEEGLRKIVDRQLAPSVLGRSAFCEELLRKYDFGQYVIFAAGYDTFSVIKSAGEIPVFELDLPEMLADKRKRLDKCGLESGAVFVPCDLSEDAWCDKLLRAGYRTDKTAFASLLGISYYLEKTDFTKLLRTISGVMREGSVLCLDYPAGDGGREAETNRALAHGAGETMKASYGAGEMKTLLRGCGFEVLESLDADEMTERYFGAHNAAEPEHEMHAPAGVSYAAAIKLR